MSEFIFVYGTLLSKLRLNPFLEGATMHGAGLVRAHLYNLGDYPGMIDSPAGDLSKVTGEVYAVSLPLLLQLDELEEVVPDNDAASLYLRRRIALVQPAEGLPDQVWCYLYNRSVQGFTRIPSGDYKAYLSAKATSERG